MIGIVSFGSGSRAWIRAGNRLRGQLKQMESSDFYSRVYSNIDELNLSPDDFSFVRKNPKGMGYWIWKPHAILKMLEEHPNVNTIVYLDAGCDISIGATQAAIRTLLAEMAGKNAIVFEMPHLLEYQFTKRSLATYLDATEIAMESPQIAGGVFCLERQFAVRFCNRWIDVMRSDSYEYLLDETGLSESNFIAHRHDQSIFSLLMKQEASDQVLIKNLSFFETQNSFLSIARNRSSLHSSDRSLLAMVVKIFEKIIDRIDRYCNQPKKSRHTDENTIN